MNKQRKNDFKEVSTNFLEFHSNQFNFSVSSTATERAKNNRNETRNEIIVEQNCRHHQSKMSAAVPRWNRSLYLGGFNSLCESHTQNRRIISHNKNFERRIFGDDDTHRKYDEKQKKTN